jgi:hypothetical protein
MLLWAELSSVASSLRTGEMLKTELAGPNHIGNGLLDRRRGDEGHASANPLPSWGKSGIPSERR